MQQCIVIELAAHECLDRTPDEIIAAVKNHSIYLGNKGAIVTFHSLPFIQDLLQIAAKSEL